LFVLGIRVGHLVGWRDRTFPFKYSIQSSDNFSLELKKLKQLMIFLQLVIISMLILRASTQGLAIFAADPEMAKVDVNSGGFGLITRILGPAISMSSAIAMLLLISKSISVKRCIWMLMPVILALLSSGSKGAFISLLGAYVVALIYQKRTISSFVIPQVGRSVAVLIALLFSYSLLVLLLRGSNEESSMLFALTMLGVRFLAYGDALYYFFFNDLYRVISLQPLDYVWDYFFSPVLAMSRLIEYPITLGLRISGEMFGMEKGGPNPTMFVEGYAYFGYSFGLVYAFFIGVMFQFLRFNAFNAFSKFSAWNYLRFSILFNIASTLPTDMILVVGDMVNATLVFLLIWLLHQVYLIYSRTLSIKIV
jgi:hypothetical protein